MTKPNSTLIAIILDRSGSMGSVVNDTIGGFNTFLTEQRKTPSDEARLTLVQFDTQYEVVYNLKPLAEVPNLDHKTYIPRGSTALLDAMGKTIHDVGVGLAAMPESERPSKVVVVVITDGEENASREYTKERVGEMIKLQSEVYDWQFVFLGANFDAIGAGSALNISVANAMNFDASAAGMGVMYRSLSSNISSYRQTSAKSDLSFTAEQRAQNSGGRSGTNTPQQDAQNSPTGHTADELRSIWDQLSSGSNKN